MAASRLGCDVAAIKAVNEVESRGSGFLEDGRPIFAYENIARVRTQGIEATARFSPVAGVTGQANYSYLDAENRSGPTPLAIPYTPHHSGNLSVSWQANEKLLKLIAQEFTTQEIADNLFISLKTVESHRSSLLSKLNARNSVGLVRIALENHLLD